MKKERSPDFSQNDRACEWLNVGIRESPFICIASCVFGFEISCHLAKQMQQSTIATS